MWFCSVVVARVVLSAAVAALAGKGGRVRVACWQRCMRRLAGTWLEMRWWGGTNVKLFCGRVEMRTWPLASLAGRQPHLRMG